MIANLWQYFGVVGCLSVAGWLAALILLGIFSRNKDRTRFWLYALAIALVGLGLAKLNSRAVNAIQIDRTAQEAEEAKKRQAEQATAPDQTPGVHFAEDAPTDKLDLAGKKSTDDSEPLYKQMGKQTRAKSTNSTIVSEGAKPVVAEVKVRSMLEADVLAANQYDRFNLFLARLTLWLALGLVVYDYFSRVNNTCDNLVPLPIAGRLLDSVYPKSHTVLIAKRDNTVIQRYLENTVRRGENFIYYGPTDPLPTDSLPRLKIGKWTIAKLPKLVLAPGRKPLDNDFIHESAWFSRYCFVILGQENTERMLAELYRFLETRHLTHAYAWRTVHVVWNCDTPIPEEDFKMFAYLCREANFKLIVFSQTAPAPTTSPVYEEVIAG